MAAAHDETGAAVVDAIEQWAEKELRPVARKYDLTMGAAYGLIPEEERTGGRPRHAGARPDGPSGGRPRGPEAEAGAGPAALGGG